MGDRRACMTMTTARKRKQKVVHNATAMLFHAATATLVNTASASISSVNNMHTKHKQHRRHATSARSASVLACGGKARAGARIRRRSGRTWLEEGRWWGVRGRCRLLEEGRSANAYRIKARCLKAPPPQRADAGPHNETGTLSASQPNGGM